MALIWWVLSVWWTLPACAPGDRSQCNFPPFCPSPSAASCPTWAPPRWTAGTTPAPSASSAAVAGHRRLSGLRGKPCCLAWGRDRCLFPVPKTHNFSATECKHSACASWGVTNLTESVLEKLREALGTLSQWCVLIPGSGGDLWLDGVFGVLCIGSLRCHTPS